MNTKTTIIKGKEKNNITTNRKGVEWSKLVESTIYYDFFRVLIALRLQDLSDGDDDDNKKVHLNSHFTLQLLSRKLRKVCLLVTHQEVTLYAS